MQRNHLSWIPEFRQVPRVVFAPELSYGMLRGINKLVAAIRPTLGPLPRIVAIQRIPPEKPPELLDNGAIIARRIIDLPDEDENAGAMLLRGMLWRLHEETGDGTASAALLFQAIYAQGLTYLAAGGNPMLLRAALAKGRDVILAELDRQSSPATDQRQITGIAHSLCYDRELARLLGEIMETIGEHGVLDIRTGRRRESEREFIAGSFWSGGLFSREAIPIGGKRKLELENAALVLTDLEVEDPQHLLPVLQAALQASVRTLVLIGRKFSEKVMGLIAQSQKSTQLTIHAAHTPGLNTDDQLAGLEDLACLCGGRRFLTITGASLLTFRPEDFGYARQMWLDANFLGIVRGQGDPKALRAHLARLRRAVQGAEKSASREKMRERLGRLQGGAAILWVGGVTENEINIRKEMVRRALHTLRGAIHQGIVPGGGVALLACRPALEHRRKASQDTEEKAALRILSRALEAPFRALAENAGHHPSVMLGRLARAGDGFGLDARSGEIVHLSSAGILDVSAVLKSAVFSAVNTAAMALTVEALVHHRKPFVSHEPD